MERQGVRLLKTLRSLVNDTRQSRPKLRGLPLLESIVQVNRVMCLLLVVQVIGLLLEMLEFLVGMMPQHRKLNYSQMRPLLSSYDILWPLMASTLMRPLIASTLMRPLMASTLFLLFRRVRTC